MSNRIRKTALVSLLCLALPTIALAGDKVKVSPYGKVFRSHDGDLKVEMAVLDAKNDRGLNDVLLKFTGQPAHEEGIDGKTMLYKAVKGGTGVDFQYKKNNETLNRMASRESGWGNWTNFEAYFGTKTHTLYLDPKESKELKPEKLAKELQ